MLKILNKFKRENLNSFSITILVLQGFVLYMFVGTIFEMYSVSKTYLVNKELQNQIITSNKELEFLKNQYALNTNSKKEVTVDYYIKSIYAYAALSDIDLKILQKESKYNGTALFEIVFKDLTNEQIVDFAHILDKLGFVEKVETNKISLYVKSITIEEVKHLKNSDSK